MTIIYICICIYYVSKETVNEKEGKELIGGSVSKKLFTKEI